MRQWGQFPEVTRPEHRRYIRQYWRFLLNWEYPPPRNSIDLDTGIHLRVRAKEEVMEYRKTAATQGGAQIIDLKSPDPPPTTPAKKAA
jgi:hypothetical protein